MRAIDKSVIIENLDQMINALEYDSMRSAGKCKMNADALVNMYTLKGIYESELKTKPATKPAVKPASAK